MTIPLFYYRKIQRWQTTRGTNLDPKQEPHGRIEDLKRENEDLKKKIKAMAATIAGMNKKIEHWLARIPTTQNPHEPVEATQEAQSVARKRQISKRRTVSQQ